MNEQSSRSHCVFTLRISGCNEVWSSLRRVADKQLCFFNFGGRRDSSLSMLVMQSTEQQVQGVLNMIDLAGSERLSRSGAVGDRLKETQVTLSTKNIFIPLPLLRLTVCVLCAVNQQKSFKPR